MMVESNDRIAVVLFSMGGPDSLDAVEPFLFNLFQDPFLVEIPFRRILQKPLAKMIARKRSRRVKGQYSQIGGRSPINYWTDVQRRKLQERLHRHYPGCDVFAAMRYWKPFIRETAAAVQQRNYRCVVLLPLYPHYSQVTTVSAFREWERTFRADGLQQIRIERYYNHPQFLQAQNDAINRKLRQFPEKYQAMVELVFSAHGVPEKIIRRGDPYQRQIEENVRLLMELRGWDRPYHLCYQSRATPVKWIGPHTDELLIELARRGKKALLLVPISFVSDHMETLYELEIRYRELAESAGVEAYHVVHGLNDSDAFLSALEAIVTESLRV